MRFIKAGLIVIGLAGGVGSVVPPRRAVGEQLRLSHTPLNRARSISRRGAQVQALEIGGALDFA